jgi:hypothetical protein
MPSSLHWVWLRNILLGLIRPLSASIYKIAMTNVPVLPVNPAVCAFAGEGGGPWHKVQLVTKCFNENGDLLLDVNCVWDYTTQTHGPLGVSGSKTGSGAWRH